MMQRFFTLALAVGSAAAWSGSGSGSDIDDGGVRSSGSGSRWTPEPTTEPTPEPTSVVEVAESLAVAGSATQADKENTVAGLVAAGHSVVNVLEVDGVINGITCEALDTATARNALSAVLLDEFRSSGGASSDVINLLTEVCPNKYAGARRRRQDTADFSTELVTAGSASAAAAASVAASANSAGVDYSSASGAVGVDTSSIGTSGKTAYVPVSAISDTSGVTSFSNLIVNGQEKYDAMAAGTKPSDYGLSWGAICSDVGTESEGCPTWGKFEWCKTGYKYHDSNKVGEDCTAEGLVVIDGRCFTCDNA